MTLWMTKEGGLTITPQIPFVKEEAEKWCPVLGLEKNVFESFEEFRRAVPAEEDFSESFISYTGKDAKGREFNIYSRKRGKGSSGNVWKIAYSCPDCDKIFTSNPVFVLNKERTEGEHAACRRCGNELYSIRTSAEYDKKDSLGKLASTRI